MFYDNVSTGYLSLMNELRGVCNKARSMGLSEKINNMIKMLGAKINELEIRKQIHDNNAKCFFIDNVVQDSLLNVPHNIDQDYSKSIKLPFPFIFFELEDPFELDLAEVTGESYMIKGLTFARFPDLIQKRVSPTPNNTENVEKQFEILTHYVDTKSCYNAISFNVNTLPSFLYIKKNIFSSFQIEDGVECEIVDENGNTKRYETLKMLPSKKYYFVPTKEDIYQINYEYAPVNQMIDLCVNLINYINAQNVTLIKKEREKKSLEQIKKINRKRIGQGKIPFVPKKPYYVIEVRKHVYMYEEEEGEREKLWELNYRVWVRGHFRHYKDGVTIWIEPHVRGPLDAPWKHNRYEVLYKRFRHLLKNPKHM